MRMHAASRARCRGIEAHPRSVFSLPAAPSGLACSLRLQTTEIPARPNWGEANLRLYRQQYVSQSSLYVPSTAKEDGRLAWSVRLHRDLFLHRYLCRFVTRVSSCLYTTVIVFHRAFIPARYCAFRVML